MVNESISLRMHGHSLTFMELYRERKEGLTRPRLNESSIDPDLLLYPGMRDKSNIYERWNDEERRSIDFLPKRRVSELYAPQNEKLKSK